MTRLLITQDAAIEQLAVTNQMDTMLITNFSDAIAQSIEWTKESFAQFTDGVAICFYNETDRRQLKMVEIVTESLESLFVQYCVINLFGKFDNYLDYLLNVEHDGVADKVAEIAKIESLEAYNEQLKASDYQNSECAQSFLGDFIGGIHSEVATEFVSTGFDQLDDVLDGGLHAGLYVIGAISSLGKTTLALQIADNIAQQGHDALIISLEMSRHELIAKSISRNTALLAVSQNLDLHNAKTTRGITVGSRYKNYSQIEKQLIDDSVKAYGEYARHLYIKEGVGDVGVDEIRNMVDKHIAFTGQPPVVFVDYLQILAPNNERASDKQNTDKAILELKRISRDYNIPVFVISSFNRSSYDKEVTMSSFKESGAVEYSADVLIGMNFSNIKSKSFNERDEKAKDSRDIDVTVLKNRNGRLGEPIKFLFHSMFNFFEEL